MMIVVVSVQVPKPLEQYVPQLHLLLVHRKKKNYCEGHLDQKQPKMKNLKLNETIEFFIDRNYLESNINVPCFDRIIYNRIF